jgi:hypothetical protein
MSCMLSFSPEPAVSHQTGCRRQCELRLISSLVRGRNLLVQKNLLSGKEEAQMYILYGVSLWIGNRSRYDQTIRGSGASFPD